LADLFATGRIVDGILALTVLEGCFLVLWRRRTDLLITLLAGLGLLAALRLALAGAAWPWLALALLAALAAHVADLARRWR
jgi:hypothetical protein